ncbi:MAG: FAD-dependent oxidoreductase [Pseudomonadota bacterium]
MAPDILVIGAGIFGLSVAWAAHRAGLSVKVLEAAPQLGAGSSGGVVGALTAHAPTRWRPMMAFQFQALLDLPGRVAEIEAATDLSCGYGRTGRWTPLVSAKALAKAEADVEAAPKVWGDAASMTLHAELPPETAGWISPEAAPFGVLHDTISARIDPLTYLDALALGLGDAVQFKTEVTEVLRDGRVATSDGMRSSGALVLAAGWQGWDLIAPLVPALAGSAVKGQAALLRPSQIQHPTGLIYQDGLYIIPHASGDIAVGSTSEKAWNEPFRTDAKLDDIVAKAQKICPALQDAKIIQRWAGLRPKPPGREPLVGPVPGMERIWVAGGGFKIGFGIAHAVGDALVDMIQGKTPKLPVPETFLPSNA